jgi:hypothetical protein
LKDPENYNETKPELSDYWIDRKHNSSFEERKIIKTFGAFWVESSMHWRINSVSPKKLEDLKKLKIKLKKVESNG